jgi:O-methyltransferase
MNELFSYLIKKFRILIKKSNNYVWPIETKEIDKENYNRVKPFTGTSESRAFALVQAIRYIVGNNIPGDFIEFGVARGGSAMLIALTLKDLGVEDRDIYLYDLFGTRPKYGEWDVEMHSGKSVGDYYALVDQGDRDAMKNWEFYSEAEVMQNLRSTGYNPNRIHLIRGDVCETLNDFSHTEVALMRLDTDFYESTKHELTSLYPKLSKNGVMIIDDYGHWLGARRATDEFLQGLPLQPLLFYIDNTARQILKN